MCERKGRGRDTKGRYTPAGSPKSVVESRTKKLLKFLRSSFENRFIVSFVRFVFNRLLSRVLSNQTVYSSLYTRIHSISLSIGKWLNWSVVLSFIVWIFMYAYEFIRGWVGSIHSRIYQTDDTLWGKFKGIFSSSSQTTPQRVSTWPLFMIEKLFPGSSNSTTTDLSSLLPSSVWGRALIVIVGGFLFYFIMRSVVRRICLFLFNSFVWATPGDFQTLKDLVTRHTNDSLVQIRQLGNKMIIMDHLIKELQASDSIKEEDLKRLKGIGADVAEFRRIEQSYVKVVDSMGGKLETIEDKADGAINLMQTTMKRILASVGSKPTLMGSQLIDDHTVAKSLRIARALREDTSRISRLYPLSVRSILDPNAEITMNVGGISTILENSRGVGKGKEPADSMDYESAEDPLDQAVAQEVDKLQGRGGTSEEGTSSQGGGQAG